MFVLLSGFMGPASAVFLQTQAVKRFFEKIFLAIVPNYSLSVILVHLLENRNIIYRCQQNKNRDCASGIISPCCPGNCCLFYLILPCWWHVQIIFVPKLRHEVLPGYRGIPRFVNPVWPFL